MPPPERSRDEHRRSRPSKIRPRAPPPARFVRSPHSSPHVTLPSFLPLTDTCFSATSVSASVSAGSLKASSRACASRPRASSATHTSVTGWGCLGPFGRAARARENKVEMPLPQWRCDWSARRARAVCCSGRACWDGSPRGGGSTIGRLRRRLSRFKTKKRRHNSKSCTLEPPACWPLARSSSSKTKKRCALPNLSFYTQGEILYIERSLLTDVNISHTISHKISHKTSHKFPLFDLTHTHPLMPN